MLNFEFITSEMLASIKPHLANNPVRLCDYAVGCIYLWRDYFRMKSTFVSNMLISTSETSEDGLYYTYPVGDGDFYAAIEAIKRDAEDRNIPLKFCCVPKDGIDRIKEYLGEPESISFDRTWSDYLYRYESFCGFKGKALHSQRNHVNRFFREYPDYSFVPLTESNIHLAKKFMFENHAEFAKEIEIANEELSKIDMLLNNFTILELSGGLLSVGERIIGLTIGETMGDTLHVHVEKALFEYHGSFQMLAMSFAEMMKTNKLKYINRQDDAGDEGLRKSKLSYKPCELLDKYYLIF